MKNLGTNFNVVANLYLHLHLIGVLNLVFIETEKFELNATIFKHRIK